MTKLTVTCTGADAYELVLKGHDGVQHIATSTNKPLRTNVSAGDYTLWRTVIGSPGKKWKVKLTGAVFANTSPPKNSEERAISQRGFFTGARIIKVG